MLQRVHLQARLNWNHSGWTELLCRCYHWHNHYPAVVCQAQACVLQDASLVEQEELVWPLPPLVLVVEEVARQQAAEVVLV